MQPRIKTEPPLFEADPELWAGLAGGTEAAWMRFHALLGKEIRRRFRRLLPAGEDQDDLRQRICLSVLERLGHDSDDVDALLLPGLVIRLLDGWRRSLRAQSFRPSRLPLGELDRVACQELPARPLASRVEAARARLTPKRFMAWFMLDVQQHSYCTAALRLRGCANERARRALRQLVHRARRDLRELWKDESVGGRRVGLPR